MPFNFIKYSAQKRIAHVTLSIDETANSMDSAIVSELSQGFAMAQKDSSVKVVILNSGGDDFCSGLEPIYLEKISKFDFGQNLKDSTELMKLYQLIYSLRKPVIALVQGNAFSYGCGLVSVCDIVIAAKETAKFCCPEVQYGLIPATFLYFLVRRVGESKARELVLLGSQISADEAMSAGLVNIVVPMVELEAVGTKMAQQLAENNSSSSMGLIKELLSRIHGMSINDALEYATNLNALARMTEDSKHGIESLLKNEKAQW